MYNYFNTLEEFIGEDNPVRVIDAFVEHLNMTELEIEHAKPANTGRPPYDPKDLLKLYLYGYFNRIRSSRRLMVECGRNIELFYLLKHLTPDQQPDPSCESSQKNLGCRNDSCRCR